MHHKGLRRCRGGKLEEIEKWRSHNKILQTPIAVLTKRSPIIFHLSPLKRLKAL
ncbi:MAG: hypothetical protein WBM86_01855 [Waterburya sp.]